MSKNQAKNASLKDALKRSIDGLCGCLDRVCNELDELNQRLSVAERELVSLAQRADKADLQNGVVKGINRAIPEKIGQIESEVTQSGH